MTPSTRPYLIKAIYQWSIDIHCTPHVLVDTDIAAVKVPSQYIQDSQIVLNIHPQAVTCLDISNEWILFSARFSGQEHSVEIPINAVLAIFAKENGEGMTFPKERTMNRLQSEDLHNTPVETPETEKKKHPTLTLVE